MRFALPPARAALAAALLAVLTFAVLAVTGHGASAVGTVCCYGVLLGAAGAALARGVRVRRERAVWLLVGSALLVWAAGFLVWRLAYGHGVTEPSPSVSDALELSAYPLLFAAILLLARARLQVRSAAVWLDGLAAALAAGAIGALVMAGPLGGLSGESTAGDITALAYPVGDVLIVGLTIGLLAVRGLNPGRTWILLLLGGLTFAVTDCLSLYDSVVGTYVAGAPVDVGWTAGVLLIGLAAWQPIEERATIDDGQHSIALPAGLGVVSLGVLAVDHFDRLSAVAVVAATLSLGVILQRFVLTFALSRRLIAARGHEAITDPLTGLGNRRAMMRALETVMDGEDRAHLLAILDLDGFKSYNDTFGHLAGDLLLSRLSRRLSTAAAEHGATAYRMGGDEFCVFGPAAAGPGPAHLLAWAVAALSEQGDGFAITASGGHTTIDARTVDASAALSQADERMYGSKRSQRASALTQTTAVLRAVEDACDAELSGHTGRVADLAGAVARHLGLPEPEVRWIRCGADLHDIGKVAIPAAIVDKPGRLDPDEWAFIRRHTIIGEYIAQSAQALAPVAPLIRASHERWDGSGYPDGVAGDAIPLGAQIIFVCDAFDAMVSERSYRRALTARVALAELTAGAGTQFSPQVVAAFVACWERERRTGRPTVAPPLARTATP